MHQFLAQTALIHRIKLERPLVGAVRLNLGGSRLEQLVDMCLDSQSLEEESQQGQGGDPPS